LIVVDASILAYCYLSGQFTTAARALMREEPDWAAPLLWRSELRSVLTGYLRRQELSVQEARRIQSEAEDLMRDNEYEVDSPSVLDLVSRCDCSAYDCEYVALATQLGTRLVTMDAKVLRAFPQVAAPLCSLSPGS
jgi:predicted nucleic acid-binding protein